MKYLKAYWHHFQSSADAPWLQLTHLILLILPVVLILIVIGAILQRRNLRKAVPVIAVIVFTLALTGVVAGYSGGISRVGVVGNLVPAILGLLGGVVIYLFGVDQSKGLIGSIATAALVTGFFLGYSYGAEKRSALDVGVDQRAFCAEVFGNSGAFASPEGQIILIGDFRDACFKAYGMKKD